MCLCDSVTATVNSDYCIGANTINLSVFVIDMQCVYFEVCVCCRQQPAGRCVLPVAKRRVT